MQTLEKQICRHADVLAQWFRRLVKISTNSTESINKVRPENYCYFLKSYDADLLFDCYKAYAKVEFNNFTLLIKQPDSFCYLQNRIIVVTRFFKNYLTVQKNLFHFGDNTF